jgi:Peptidase M76 family
MGPSPFSIVVCQNRILPPNNNSTPNANTDTTHLQKRPHEMDEIVRHELIFIYDVRTLKLDLLLCADLAYSEIRSVREAECSSLRRNAVDDITLFSNIRTSAATYSNIMNDDTKLHLQHRHAALKQCVRSLATTATQNLFAPGPAQRCIQQVFARAMADERPSRSAADPAE